MLTFITMNVLIKKNCNDIKMRKTSFVDEEAILHLLHFSKNKESRYRCSRVLSRKDKLEEIFCVNKRYFNNEAALDLRL